MLVLAGVVWLAVALAPPARLEDPSPDTGEEAPSESSVATEEVPPPPAPSGLAVPVRDTLREKGLVPTLVQAIPQRAEGPEDGVVVTLEEIDRTRFQKLMEQLVEIFVQEDGSGELPVLRRVSLILSDPQGVVHKHELQRDAVLRARASEAAFDQWLAKLGKDTYPEGESPPAPGKQSGEELRWKPEHTDPNVVKMLAESRFPQLSISLEDGTLVVTGAREELDTARIFLGQVDQRAAGGSE